MTTQKCTVCHRKVIPDGKYCLHHKQAFDNIMNHYKAWVDAYGEISWQEFLDKLSGMRETGIWVREVIAAESKK